MAALANRTEKEQAFSRNVLKSFADYKDKIAAYQRAGKPVPEEVWQEIEQDFNRKLAAILLLLFTDSASQHGAKSLDVISFSETWSQERAKKIAEDFARNSREMTDRGIGPFEPWRAEAIATTETTQAASAGGEHGVFVTVGQSDTDTWYTANDDRVCPVCGPLHGSERKIWQERFPEGPPGHVNCRCFIQYQAEKN